MDESQVDAVLNEVERSFLTYLHNSPENVENSSNALVADLIDDAILGVVFEVDFRRKTSVDERLAGETNEQDYHIDTVEKDIFGLMLGKKNYECVCPECKRNLAASRFAPHLEKCMGMGRNSSRVASLRIANNANNKDSYTAGSGSAGGASWTDDEDDVDWTAAVEKKGSKKKKEVKPGVVKKMSKYSKLQKNGSLSMESSSSNSSSCSTTGISYEAMTARDRHALLSQICGVLVESATKICTKSLKCSVHSDEQRRALREEYAPSETILETLQVIDVDGIEEGEIILESISIETPIVSSPADSASTSSSSSKSKSKKSKTSKLTTPPKSHRNSPASAIPDD